MQRRDPLINNTKAMLNVKTQHNIKAQLIEEAIINGTKDYFAQCRLHVPTFITQHFRYPGCWKTNCRGFGLDLLRAPLNLIWAPIYVLLIALLLLLSLFGFKRATTWASKLPGGMTTNVQRYINAHIQTELIAAEQLKICIIKRLTSLKSDHDIDESQQQQWMTGLTHILDDALVQLMLTRTASADISNTLLSTAAGALAFKKFTPGGVGIGILLAALWVKERSKQHFILGSTIGGWYYSVFPPQASYLETGVSIGAVMLLLAIFASFSGLITDPVQAIIRIHQWRLMRMLNKLEQDLLNKTSSSFKPIDPYIARILELFDTLKAQINF